ncbi:MAG: hypothetical protein O3A81_04785, partial [bacterium]|nr:hypothetical protein [bacterium]
VVKTNFLAGLYKYCHDSILAWISQIMDSFSPGDLIGCPAKGAGINFEEGTLTEGLVVFRVGAN